MNVIQYYVVYTHYCDWQIRYKYSTFMV